MDYSQPEVLVTQLSLDDIEGVQPTANLGDFGTELVFNGVLDAMRDRADEALLLTWRGGKIPRGTEVAGAIIAWTQNSVVTSDGGDIIGTYSRLQEFGGPERDNQAMIVFPFKVD